MARAANRAWQRMLSGRRLDILDPSPLDVELSDIAHGLARVARWNGQTLGDYPFSVAQHSVLVLEIFRALNREATVPEQLYAVLHDAPEYVMGDIISPFKAAMGGNYKEVENRLLGAVHLRFSLGALPPVSLNRRIKVLIRPWPTREAHDRFAAAVEDLAENLT
ncbi:MAG: HD family hydrolase [Alphaproteobacteria bacterium]|nr:MAG: HD family hydrolase [Alphaproteobacteria bacterium]